MDKMHIFYNSTVKGQATFDDEKDYVYYGSVFRIPDGDFNQFGSDGDLSKKYFDEQMEGLLKHIEELEAEGLTIGQPIERFEIREMGTGDLLVMWRIPAIDALADVPPGEVLH